MESLNSGKLVSSGGPPAPLGRRAARHNAVTHGLTSKKLVPEILDQELIHEHYEALREEWTPTTPTQDFLVRDLARHQAALDRTERIELAVLRRGAPGNLTLRTSMFMHRSGRYFTAND